MWAVGVASLNADMSLPVRRLPTMCESHLEALTVTKANNITLF